MFNKVPDQARRFVSLICLLGIGFLCTGTVVKRKNAIQMTQTDPVGVNEALKEQEEGKKGPPVPTLKLFPKERFLIEGPVNKEQRKEGEAEEFEFTEPEEGEEAEEGLTEEVKAEEVTDDTFDTEEEGWDFDDAELGEEEEPLP